MRSARSNARARRGCRCGGAAITISIAALLVGCPLDTGVVPINPFLDVPPIELDGVARDLTTTVIPLGDLAVGEVLQIDVSGTGIDAVLVLAKDDFTESAGVVVGGGRADAAFQYRIPHSGRFAVFVLFDPQLAEAERTGTIAVGSGDPTFLPRSRQQVLVVFAPNFLTGPGLLDPQSGTTDELSFLQAISGTVREGILARLVSIFAGTPVEILTDGDPLPTEPFSTVTLLPDRVVAEDPLLTDSALPPFDPSRPECQERVVFGEVLPRGVRLDPGNQVPDDKAVVYVGSFQGRGETCRSAALDSVNTIVLGLAQTTAHEIGHLVGLFHVPLTDLMDRSPTLAFQRELSFQRGQVLIDARTELSDGTAEVTSLILTSVIQDPAAYFSANFGP